LFLLLNHYKKELPKEEVKEFLLWLESVAVSSGLGRHFEYYSYTDNYKDDIPVSFKVELNY
jgi:hypothetical protein